VKVGVTIPAYELSSRRPRSFQAMVEDVLRAEQLGYDSIWVMDHVFVERSGARRGAGPEPLTFLSFVAARTERVQLGTLVLCAAFRPPVQLAREAKALNEASGGRLVLGVGSGWHQPEFDAFGFPFDHLVSRFEEHLEVLTRLLGDGPSDFEGRYQVLRGGQVFGLPAPPPWVAASGRRMRRLTGRLAAGWNGAWYGSDRSRFSDGRAEVEAGVRAAGRDPSQFQFSAGIFVGPGEDPRDERVIGGSPEEIAEALAGYRAAGCDHAILNFAPAPFAEVDPSHPARLAPLLDRFR
jgi:alkanesulfonate monooxygenase SsuD/methylene tetrahydromethanopterin reductase-like flavin-dependent oxidoreductase (luciferase family)